MHFLGRTVAIGLSVSIGLATSMRDARADIFDTFAGFVSDPLKLGKLSDQIQRSLIQIDNLEAQGNEHAQELLAQLKNIVDEVITNGTAAEEEAFKKLNDLQLNIAATIINVIYKAECATIVVLDDKIQQAIVSAAENLAKTQPTLKILGIPLVEFTTRKVVLPDPYTAYAETKKAVLDDMQKSFTETTPAYKIIVTYQNLKNLALSAECHYQNGPVADELVNDAADYDRLSAPWTKLGVKFP